MPEFKNRPNERFVLPDGKEIYKVRSSAVVACVVCVSNNEPYVLMVERGPQVDNSGLWCMPCGYLDWDETFAEAVRRELFEETGLDLAAFADRIIQFDLETPYYIESSPKAHRQNISHHFGIVISGPRPVLKDSDGLRSGEITSVEWVKASTLPLAHELEASPLKGHFAFHHNEKARRFVDKLTALPQTASVG